MDEQESTVNITSGGAQGNTATWTCPACHLKIPTTTSICPQDGTLIDSQRELDQTLAETYDFIGTIGTGGMGVIYKARQKMLNKIVAIKMLHSHLLSIQSMLRFQQEAKAASSLKHPSVIAVHDFGISEQGQPYMVMDFIEGITLAEMLRDKGVLDLSEALDIFIAIADALEHAHSHNVLHRDLKSSNVMLTEKEKGYDVHLLDFGIAKIVDSDAGGNQHLTQTGEMIGSPLYMSPEQCMGKKVDHRSDIYSFGCILYESVTGQPPHRGETILETIFKHLNETPKPLRLVRSDIKFPEAFETLVMKLLATKPEDRVQTISQVKDELRSIQSGAIGSGFQRKAASALSRIKFRKATLLAATGVVLALFGLVALAVSTRNVQVAEEMKAESAKELKEAADISRQSSSSRSAAAPSIAGEEVTPNTLNRFSPYTESMDLSGKTFRENTLLFLQKFPRLHSLNLSNTAVSSYVIRPLAGLKSLTKLSLNNTNLPPDALAELSNFHGLTELNLENTETNDATLLALSKMPELETLSIRDTAITDKGLENLLGAKKLKSLSISGTSITNRGLASLGKMDLSTLNMWDTKASQGAVVQLRNCKNLSQLCLRKIELSAADLQAISQFSKLNYLELYNIKSLKDSDLNHFVGLKSLEELYIENCPLTNDSAKYLVQMQQLEGLGLIDTNISDPLISQISSMENLEKLWLTGTKVRDFKALSKLKNLEELHVSDTLADDVSIKDIATIPNLSSLEIWYCQNLTRNGLAAFARLKPKCSVSPGYLN